ncbi:MAG: tRNA guanosine(34) transglycosylase Tgt [Candidatus Buchananbacteria bacterium]|nr:tRNA guanosine(34) transglycosylase Tgt [Candidatus Buchananbacteria bacterium]
MFKIKQKSKKTQARLGQLKTWHGEIKTPFFMPIATKAAVKNISTDELEKLGTQIILANTYHLYLQPGKQIIKKHGGIHEFLNWSKPILSDSGGYQVFSLAKIRKIKPDGVEFQSHLDGSKHLLTPVKSIKIQQSLGVDIMMALDVCPAGNADFAAVRQANEITYDWLKKCKQQWLKGNKKQLLFGIMQGSTFKNLRDESLGKISSLDLPGYAIGGLAVGEPRDKMYEILQYITPKMPINKPRYLMGLGRPEEIVFAVKQGVDMFDCVIPTREARHGRLYQFCAQSEKDSIELFDNLFYKTLIVKNNQYKENFEPINQASNLELLNTHSKAYLHHLFKTQEGLGLRLATLNNLEFYLELMREIRQAIKANNL